MATILSTKSIYYNDVNLITNRPGKVPSRKDIPKELYRIIVSPMPSIVGEKFVKEAARLGLSVALPREFPLEKQALLRFSFFMSQINPKQKIFFGLGLNVDYKEFLIAAKTEWKIKDSVLFDIAHGGIPQLKEIIYNFQKFVHIDNLMVGNIMSGNMFNEFTDNYKNFAKNIFVRVGVAGGSPCATSDTTGFNRGQITELIECDASKKQSEIFAEIKNMNICADGGIKNSGYAAKAFGAGADYLLMGGYFKRALEAETNVNGDGTYWGCASYKQIEREGLNKTHSEGKVVEINKDELVPLERLTTELWGGLSSAVSYSGYSTLTDFIGQATFEVKQNSLPPKNR